jgi:hypothetical protein
MHINKYYKYVFYKLYNFYENGPSVWMSEWKASFSMDVLWYFTIYSIAIYYNIFINRYFHQNDSFIEEGALVILVAVFNYLIFNRNDRWRGINDHFKKLPKRKNLIGGWIVFGFILTIVVNLIVAFFLMSRIDWQVYR